MHQDIITCTQKKTKEKTNYIFSLLKPAIGTVIFETRNLSTFL